MVGRPIQQLASPPRRRKRLREPPGHALGWPQNDQYRLLQPQITAEGIHVWPFDSVLPVDLRFQTSDGKNNGADKPS